MTLLHQGAQDAVGHSVIAVTCEREPVHSAQSDIGRVAPDTISSQVKGRQNGTPFQEVLRECTIHCRVIFPPRSLRLSGQPQQVPEIHMWDLLK